MPPPTERCTPCGKWTHRTKGDAMAGALASSRKFDGQPYRTYACPEGNGWHITSKPDRPTAEEETNPMSQFRPDQIDADMEYTERTAAVLYEISRERGRQDAKWGEQNHPDGTGGYPEEIAAFSARQVCQAAAEGGYLDWLHILREEVAEAFAESDPARLRAELVQVAAVATCWIESIDRRSGRG